MLWFDPTNTNPELDFKGIMSQHKSFKILNICFIVESVLMIIVNLVAIRVIVSLNILKISFYNLALALLFASHFTTGIALLITSILNLASAHDNVVSLLELIRDCSISLEINFTILLSFERFIAVRKPFFYAKLTTRHGAAAIGVVLALTAFFTIWRTISTKAYISAFFVAIIGAVLIIVSNFLLYRSVKRQCRQIAATIIDKSSKQQNDKRQGIRKRELRSLKVCLFIASSYILTWVPLIVIQTIFQNDDSILFKFLAIVTFTNGIWDVFIFFALNFKARTKLLTFLHLSKPVQRKYSDMYVTAAFSPPVAVRRNSFKETAGFWIGLFLFMMCLSLSYIFLIFKKIFFQFLLMTVKFHGLAKLSHFFTIAKNNQRGPNMSRIMFNMSSLFLFQ